MADIRKTKLERTLEEANIIKMNRVEKLERLVARNEYKDSRYLVVAKKREAKIQGMVDNKKVLMHERRLILYDMAQTELKVHYPWFIRSHVYQMFIVNRLCDSFVPLSCIHDARVL